MSGGRKSQDIAKETCTPAAAKPHGRLQRLHRYALNTSNNSRPDQPIREE